jgi:putative ABC transport system permease protein
MIAVIFSIALTFNTFNVIFNPNIFEKKGLDYTIMGSLGFIIQAVASLLMFFANSYYIEEKMTEYGVIALTGKSVYEIGGIMLLRSFFTSGLSIFLGCALGVITSPLITVKMYSISNFNGNPSFLSFIGLITTFLLLCIQFTAVTLINTGSIYTKNISDLMNYKSVPFLSDKRDLKVNSKVYVFVFLLPIIIFLLPIIAEDKMKFLLLVIILASYGTQGLVRYFIPDLLYKYRTKRLNTNKIRIISISNLYRSIQKAVPVILMLIITSTLTIGLSCTYESGSVLNLISLTCFIVSVGVLSLTTVYKFLAESSSRRENFIQLKLLGYTKMEILKIIIEEVVLFYGIILSIALAHILLIIITSNSAGYLSTTIGLKIVIGFIFTFVLTGFISFLGYKKIAL